MCKDNNVQLEELFDYSRVTSRYGLFSLLLYAPFGLVLFIIRFFIGLHVFLITIVLPKHSYLRSLILRPFLVILGLFYFQENTQNIDPNCKVLIANYTTALDHAVLHLAMPHHLVSVWDHSSVMQWVLGLTELGASSGRELLVQNAKKHCKESRLPLLSFPECETTNGRKGLLKFSSWPFSLEQTIQPITIKITRPLFPVAPSLINSFLLTDLFWMLFLPATFFHINYLPVQQATGDANYDSHKAQVAMATHMGLAVTPCNSKDKLELIKRITFEEHRTVRPERNSAPLAAASKTSAETPHVSKAEGFAQKPVFERNSHDRHLSFQEKKALFIETARKKYLEKHS